MREIWTETRLIESMFDYIEFVADRPSLPIKLRGNWDHIRETLARGLRPDWNWDDLQLEEVESRELVAFLSSIEEMDEASQERAQAAVILLGMEHLNLHTALKVIMESDEVTVVGAAPARVWRDACVTVPLAGLNEGVDD